MGEGEKGRREGECHLKHQLTKCTGRSRVPSAPTSSRTSFFVLLDPVCNYPWRFFAGPPHVSSPEDSDSRWLKCYDPCHDRNITTTNNEIKQTPSLESSLPRRAFLASPVANQPFVAVPAVMQNHSWTSTPTARSSTTKPLRYRSDAQLPRNPTCSECSG